MSLNEKLQKIASEEKSDWLEEIGKKITNRGSRENAGKVALRVLHTLRMQGISQTELAERMGISRQQVSKIVKGKENFTFETIDKLEKALNIKLMTIGPPAEELSFDRSKLMGGVSVPQRTWEAPIDIHPGFVTGSTCMQTSVRLLAPMDIPIIPAIISDISTVSEKDQLATARSKVNYSRS